MTGVHAAAERWCQLAPPPPRGRSEVTVIMSKEKTHKKSLLV